jgi:WhiB family redox-sensing transcriptional regulator
MQQQAPAIPPEPPEWTRGALCLQVDPEMFFVDKGGDTRPAKRICASCSFVAECRVFGMGEQYGIYGGLTATDRRRLRNGRAA